MPSAGPWLDGSPVPAAGSSSARTRAGQGTCSSRALVSGGTSAGADVHVLGVCPTPALAYVTAAAGYAAGVMVSASHNPAPDNGLKVLDGQGMKLDDAQEDELENLLLGADELPSPLNEGMGRLVDARAEIDLLPGPSHRPSPDASRSDLRIHVDCAHGSGSALAPASSPRAARASRPISTHRTG